MSKRLKFVISLLSLLSFIFIGYSIPRLEIREIPYLLFWIFLGALFESLPIYYAKGRTVSVTFAITLAAQLSHGVYFAAIVAAFTAILAIFKDSKGTYKHLFNLPISVSLINLSNYTISMFLAGWFYHYLERIWSSFSSIPVMPIATLAYVILVFLLNSLIMSLYTSLMTDNPFLKTWVSGTLWALPNFIAIAPIGFIIRYTFLRNHIFICYSVIARPGILSCNMELQGAITTTLSKLDCSQSRQRTNNRRPFRRVAYM